MLGLEEQVAELSRGCVSLHSEEELLKSEAARRKKQENFGEDDTDRIRERREMMNKVLFQNRGSLGKPEWALKRDEERKRLQQERHA